MRIVALLVAVSVGVFIAGYSGFVAAQDALYGVPPHMVLFPKADGTSTGEFRMLELFQNGSNYVGFKAPQQIQSNSVYTLPGADGVSGAVMATDGSGNMQWVNDDIEVSAVVSYHNPYTAYPVNTLNGRLWVNRLGTFKIIEVGCTIGSGNLGGALYLVRNDGSPANAAGPLFCASAYSSTTNIVSGEDVLYLGNFLQSSYDSPSGDGTNIIVIKLRRVL